MNYINSAGPRWETHSNSRISSNNTTPSVFSPTDNRKIFFGKIANVFKKKDPVAEQMGSRRLKDLQKTLKYMKRNHPKNDSQQMDIENQIYALKFASLNLTTTGDQ